MIRSLHPIDLVALLPFAGQAPTNQAKARDKLLARDMPLWLECTLRLWLPLREKRHTLVCIEQGRILGLASARSRSTSRAWETDHLFSPHDREDICLGLLERLSATVGKHGAEKLFLRLSAASPALEAARSAGFCCYQTEYLYVSQRERSTRQAATGLRRRLPGDEYPLFRLYHGAVPPGVRSVQGMTFDDWRDSLEVRLSQEFIYERDREVLGWLRISLDGGSGCCDLLVQLSAGEEALEELVSSSMALLTSRARVGYLCSEFQPNLRQLLVKRGFVEAATYMTLAKQLAERVRDHGLMPIRA